MIHLRRLIVLVAFVPMLLLTVSNVTLYLYDRYTEMDQELIASGRNIANTLIAVSTQGDEILKKQIEIALQMTDVKSISVMDKQGKAQFSYENRDNDHPEKHPAREENRIFALIPASNVASNWQGGG